MSSRELKRLGVLARVEKEALNLVNAAEILGLELPAGEADLAALSGGGRGGAAASQRGAGVGPEQAEEVSA